MTNKTIWLASYYDAAVGGFSGISTRVFSTEAKARSWKATLEADGAEFDGDDQGFFFSVAPVRIDED